MSRGEAAAHRLRRRPPIILDGRQAAAAGRIGRLELAELRRLEVRVNVDIVTASPDGNTLLTGHRGSDNREEIKLWSQKNGHWDGQVLWSSDSSNILNCAFSPDGALIALAGADGTLELMRTNDLSLHSRLRAAEEHSTPRIWSCVFSPDSSMVAFTTASRLYWAPTADGAPTYSVARGSSIWQWCGFAPGGKRIYTAAGDGSLCWKHLHSGEEGQIGVGAPIRHGDVHPSNEQLALGCSDGAVRLWMPSMHEPTHVFQLHDEPVTRCQFSPDVTLLLTTSIRDGVARIWPVELKRNMKPLTEIASTALEEVTFNLDGSLLINHGNGEIVTYSVKGI